MVQLRSGKNTTQACEACDVNIAVWNVRIDEKCNTTFGVCDECFNNNKVCWTAFARKMDLVRPRMKVVYPKQEPR
jgi:hypothetical protein